MTRSRRPAILGAVLASVTVVLASATAAATRSGEAPVTGIAAGLSGPQSGAPVVDPKLEESVRWYTGMAGTVDDARAHELLREAVADDDPISLMWLARCYSRGRMHFEHDEARAREIAAEVIGEVSRLADEDVAEALFLMGTAFDEGLAREVDPARAAGWFHRAADHGHVLAQHNLGNKYADGHGVVQDPALAVYWWRRAAEQGDAIPQWLVGRAYETGSGVARDLQAARDWYGRAAERGNPQAREALERLDGTADTSPPPSATILVFDGGRAGADSGSRPARTARRDV